MSETSIKSDRSGTGLPGTVLALGVVSLFTDLSSEMIYPLLPLFLSNVLGAGALALGLIEGVAEATASLLKVLSGFWTDLTKRRKPFILAGYGLAGLVRPLIGLATAWPFVLAMRFFDRVGKGIRSSPRDALIADVTAAPVRGKAYGFHRSMDHAGAVLGPLLAAGLLALGVMSLRGVFLFAALPAAIAMLFIILGVRDAAGGTTPAGAVRMRIARDWTALGSEYKILLLALLVFTLGNSTDAFLILSLSQAKVSAGWVATLWSLHHVVKMIATYFGGILSDRFGPGRLIFAGWTLYALIYLGFAFATSAPLRVGLFLVYGIYFGLTEPSEKAWISRLVMPRLRGTAFGYFNGIIGLGALPASLIFGFLWQVYGPSAAFMTGTGFAVIASLILLRVSSR